jgi:hypothetical protein
MRYPGTLFSEPHRGHFFCEFFKANAVETDSRLNVKVSNRKQLGIINTTLALKSSFNARDRDAWVHTVLAQA